MLVYAVKTKEEYQRYDYTDPPHTITASLPKASKRNEVEPFFLSATVKEFKETEKDIEAAQHLLWKSDEELREMGITREQVGQKLSDYFNDARFRVAPGTTVYLAGQKSYG